MCLNLNMLLCIILVESLIALLTLCQIVDGVNDDCSGVSMQVNHEILRQGYHRELYIGGNNVYNETKSNKIVNGQLLIVENFPSGMYIDPYELKSKNLLEQISFNEVINIEEPAYRSPSLEVYVYVPLIDEKISTFILPVHLRYQRPKYCYSNSGSYYETIVLPSPKIYILQETTGYDCSSTATFPCQRNSSDICHWIPVKAQKDIPFAINVPVGCIEHEVWIIAVTSIVIIATVVKVAHTVIFTRSNKSD